MAGHGRAARTSRAFVVLAVSLSYLAYVFDILHPTFWQAGLGDWLDPYFINYLLEHWYRSISTLSDPSSPPMFFPVQKTLGYSHGLILYVPFYVPVRLFVHPFQAYSISLFLMIETGIVCLYVIFRKHFNLSFVESLLLTAFFFTSQNVINGSIGVWSQRASVFLIPPILLLLLTSLRTRPGWTRLFLAGISGCLSILLFPHDFYTAQFAFFFAATFLVPVAIVDWRLIDALPRIVRWTDLQARERLVFVATLGLALWTAFVWMSGGVRMQVLGVKIASQDWRRPGLLSLVCLAGYVGLRGVQRIRMDLSAAFTRGIAVRRQWLWAFLLGAALGSAVFLWIYLPSYLEHPSFPEQDLLDQIRVRVSSRWTGPVAALRDLGVYDTFRSFKLVFIVGILAWVPWFKVDRKTRGYIVWAMALTSLVFVIPLKIDGFSIWLAFVRKVPGFNVIRDPTRIIFLFELAFILAAGLLLTRFQHRRAYRTGIALLFLFFMISDHRADVLGYDRPRQVFRRWVESPIDIDPRCQSFFVKAASQEYKSRFNNMWTLSNIDAMFISLNHQLPTLNGYSAWVPEGWNLMNPPEPEYEDRAHAWIAKHHLIAVCALDIDARTMRLAQ